MCTILSFSDIKISMKLEVMSKSCSLYKIDENREVPRSIYQASFFSVTKTDKELSIICDSDVDISCCRKAKDLRLIRVDGSLGLNTTGIISSISDVLSLNRISFFAISTFETDYIIIEEKHLELCRSSLEQSGMEFI